MQQGPSQTYPAVALGRANADVEESIPMKVGDLAVVSHEPDSAKTVGTDHDAGQRTSVGLNLFHSIETFRTDHSCSQNQEGIKDLRNPRNARQEAEALDGEAEHWFRIPSCRT